MQTIPLSSGAANAHQSFSVSLGSQVIRFDINFLSYLDGPAWAMDLYRDGTPLALGAMLEPGCDVIETYNTGIGRLVFVGDAPTLDNLGITNELVWVAS